MQSRTAEPAWSAVVLGVVRCRLFDHLQAAHSVLRNLINVRCWQRFVPVLAGRWESVQIAHALRIVLPTKGVAGASACCEAESPKGKASQSASGLIARSSASDPNSNSKTASKGSCYCLGSTLPTMRRLLCSGSMTAGECGADTNSRAAQQLFPAWPIRQATGCLPRDNSRASSSSAWPTGAQSQGKRYSSDLRRSQTGSERRCRRSACPNQDH